MLPARGGAAPARASHGSAERREASHPPPSLHPQAEWREEVKLHFEKIKSEGTCLHRLEEELVMRRREELRCAPRLRRGSRQGQAPWTGSQRLAQRSDSTR